VSAARLVVVGDTLLDSDVIGSVTRLCPDAPAPILDLGEQVQRPGGAGLAALLAARAGQEVTLVTALGEDPPGRLLAELLAAEVDLVPMPLRGSTVRKTRVRAAGRSLLRIDSGDGRAVDGPVGAGVRAALLGAGAVLVADYGCGVTSLGALRRALADQVDRVPVVWDPHPKGTAPVPGCRLVTPNESEATGFASRSDGLEAAVLLRRRWDCSAVAMTMGARGALVATPDGCLAVPVPELDLAPHADTCGAGDAFAAGATAALLETGSLTDAVRTAVGVASRFVASGGVGSIGARRGDGAELPQPASRPGSALELAASVRRRGGRVVATGGCFDVLHPGHLDLLRQARALGDCLVVCLNSDASVRRLKGLGRPIIPERGRFAMLEALEPVDAVAVFDEDTPAALLERLRPDVWVKGGDYTLGELPEAPLVGRYGGRTVLIPLSDGYSTTRLVQAMRGELSATGGGT
jgi:D-beta-D-heptose 7-phosphate kinase / D-beta-D-heptose 1-phosphate adenosyltransferase